MRLTIFQYKGRKPTGNFGYDAQCIDNPLLFLL